MDKQLLTINEFSELTSINKPTLRFYDEISLLKPIMRKENRYRLYSYEQLSIAHMIEFMRNIGFSIPEIKWHIENRSSLKADNMLAHASDRINRKIEILYKQKKYIDARLKNLKECKGRKLCECTLVKIPNKRIQISDPIPDRESYGKASVNFVKNCRGAKSYETAYYDHLGYLFTKESFVNKTWDCPSNFYIYNRVGNGLMEAGVYAVSYDYYENVLNGKQYEDMYTFITENNLSVSGNAYGECLLNELAEKDPMLYMCKLMVKVDETDKPKDFTLF